MFAEKGTTASIIISIISNGNVISLIFPFLCKLSNPKAFKSNFIFHLFKLPFY